VQVMRPHQLEAAAFLLNILMGDAEENKKEMQKVSEMEVEEVERKEDAAGMNTSKRTAKGEWQLMEGCLEIDEVQGAGECQPLAPSLPLTGAILADDMGTGKVIRIANTAQLYCTVLNYSISYCIMLSFCFILICPILHQFFTH
jgi:hypothetical protein